MYHSSPTQCAACGRRPREEPRRANPSFRDGPLGEFYRSSDPLPRPGKGNKGPEWEPIRFEEEQPKRYWRMEARSLGPYDRASGGPRLIGYIWTWVVKNPGP